LIIIVAAAAAAATTTTTTKFGTAIATFPLIESQS